MKIASFHFLIVLIAVLFSYEGFGQSNHQWISGASENDILGIAENTDRYYSFGERLDFLKRLPRIDSSNHFFNASIYIEGYTPDVRNENNPAEFRRPFFGWLHTNLMLIKSSNKKYFKYGLDFGISGPLAGAGRYQNWTHERLDNRFVAGWENQAPDKVGLNLYCDFKQTVFQKKKHSIRLGSEQSVGNIFTYVLPHVNYQFHWDELRQYLPFNYANSKWSRISSEVTLGWRYEFHNASLQGEYFSNSAGFLNDEVIVPSQLYASFGFRYSLEHFSVFGSNSINTKRVKNNQIHNYGMIGFSWHL